MARRRSERRAQPRHAYLAELHYRPATLHPARATDVSDEGIAFEAAEPMDPGTDLELYLINKNVRIDGVVEYAEPLASGRHRIGVAFTKPEPELVEVLTAAWEHRHDKNG